MSVPTLIDGPVAPPLPPPGSKRKHRDEDTVMGHPTGAVVSQVGGVVPSPPGAPVPPSTQPTAPLAPMAPEPPQPGVAAAAVVAASPPMGVATGVPVRRAPWRKTAVHSSSLLWCCTFEERHGEGVARQLQHEPSRASCALRLQLQLHHALARRNLERFRE